MDVEMRPSPVVPFATLRAIASTTPGLRLLALHGSRAHGDARADSDWDFAFTGEPGFDADELLARLSTALGADRIDLADLDRASGQLRFRVACTAIVIHAEDDEWDRFCVRAASFWSEAGPVLQMAYEGELRELPR